MIWFIATTIIAYLIYYLFIIRKYDDKGDRIPKEKKINRKDNGRLSTKKRKEVDVVRYPAEVELFIYKYKVDIKKVNFRAMLKLLGLVCSLDIALIVTILSFMETDNMYILFGIGALLVIPVILISFSLLGRYFKKKGLTKNV